MQNNLSNIKMKKQTYKRTGNCRLFDLEENTAKLGSLGNPLEKLLKVVDFEMFRETLEAGLYKEKLTNAGAKPYDYVLMFKILVLALNTCLAIANKVCTGCSAAPSILREMPPETS